MYTRNIIKATERSFNISVIAEASRSKGRATSLPPSLPTSLPPLPSAPPPHHTPHHFFGWLTFRCLFRPG